METILDKIITARKKTLRQAVEKCSLAEAEVLAKKQTTQKPSKDFIKAITSPLSAQEPMPRVIAEVKKASPSKGLICENFHPLEIAKGYERGGASALSVLTETEFFLGSDAYLQEISSAVSLPTLRKDFIIDPYQIVEARALGTSAYLLIVDCLDPVELQELLAVGKEWGMTALVETHRKEEVEQALKAGAEVIGINNRNLRTFETSLDVTYDLRSLIPESIPVVSESGIAKSQDLKDLAERNVQTVLVGESLMRQSDDVAVALQKLLGRS
jgi:indole-3-glycerol phosphate synthase